MKTLIDMNRENIENDEWHKVFDKDIYDVTPLTFEELHELYKMFIDSGIKIDLIELAKNYNLPNTYLRDDNENLSPFNDRVERDFYDKFYTTKFAQLFKEKTFEEIYQGVDNVSTLIDSDFSGSGFNDKPTLIESFLVLSEIGYPIFRVNFINEGTGECLAAYFKLPKYSILYFPFGVFYDYELIRDAQNDLIEELETEIIG